MYMQLVSVNVGRAERIVGAKSIGQTGIYKRAVGEPVAIGPEGLAGDTICDVENHGGVDQAVYVYGTADYDWWEGELGRPLEPGAFGENLTISGLESASLSIGDRLHVGAVTLEVTAPRIPCGTLAARMGDPSFVKRFRAAERPGLYCRVIEPGVVRPGDPMRIEPYQHPTITALEMFRNAFLHDLSEETLRRHLAAPIAIRDRVEKEAQLRELLKRRSM
jgi:MOSC domain-containing protein YiiM